MWHAACNGGQVPLHFGRKPGVHDTSDTRCHLVRHCPLRSLGNGEELGHKINEQFAGSQSKRPSNDGSNWRLGSSAGRAGSRAVIGYLASGQLIANGAKRK